MVLTQTGGHDKLAADRDATGTPRSGRTEGGRP
jgi:hypothetical protein